MKPLNILHVFRAPVGGLFRHVLDLTREQTARGHRVGLIADSRTGGTRGEDALRLLEPSLALGLTRVPMRRHANPSDLFVLASRFDNNPCVLVEAQAAGLPIVATAVGGIPEIVTADAGVLARPEDPEGLAAAILDALGGLDRWNRGALAARAEARYSVEHVAQTLAGVYADALA